MHAGVRTLLGRPTYHAGKTSVGTLQNQPGSGGLAGCIVTTGVTGTMTGLWADLAGSDASQVFCSVLYTVASGHPQTLLKNGSVYTVAIAQARGWVWLPFTSGAAVTAGTQYFIGLQIGTTSSKAYWGYDAVTNGGHWCGGAALMGSPPSAYPGDNINSVQWALYADVV